MISTAATPGWARPETLETMYCHYQQVGTARIWQVLARVPDRCGPPVEVGTTRARFGEPVAVPREPGKMVLATFSFSSPLTAQVEGVLAKPPQMGITVWGGLGASPIVYRFVPGTAADYHVLATPRTLGYSPAYSPPALRQVELAGGGWGTGQGSITVKFYAVSLGR